MKRSWYFVVLCLISACGKNVYQAPTINTSKLQGFWCLQADKSLSPKERILKFSGNNLTWIEYTPGDRAASETNETHSYSIEQMHIKIKLNETTSREISVSKQESDRIEASEPLKEGINYAVKYLRISEADANRSDFACP